MILEKLVDERFLAHRTRSTALGGIAGACMAGGLFLYHYYADRLFSWDLFIVLFTISAVKLAAMGYFYATR
jgi:hypothetical protein